MSVTVNFDGGIASGAEIVGAAVNAGLQVQASTAEPPVGATALWIRAREIWPADVLEAGLPSDFRAVITRPNVVDPKHPTTEYLRVPTNGFATFDSSGNVLIGEAVIRPLEVFSPGVVPTNPNLSPGQEVWRDNETGQSLVTFHWDGTERGFVNLLSWFQLCGSLLEDITVHIDDKNGAVATAQARSYIKNHEYTIAFPQGGRFIAAANGEVTLLDRTSGRYTLIEAAKGNGDFEFTPFSIRVFRDGIDLIPAPPKKPWYKSGWMIAALISIIAVCAALLFWGQPGDDSQPTEPDEEIVVEEDGGETEIEIPEGDGTEEIIVNPEEETSEEPAQPEEEDPQPQPEEPDTEDEGTGNENSEEDGNGGGGWSWPWSGDDGWHWPWDSPQDALDNIGDRVNEVVPDDVREDIAERVDEHGPWVWPWEDGFVWPWNR